jgi:hypothetical protein
MIMGNSADWQRLVQFVGAHMHKPVSDDRADRALTIASGKLARHAKHQILSMTLPDGTRSVLRSAISPKGKMAWLIHRTSGQNGILSKRDDVFLAGRLCGLCTWSESEGFQKPTEYWEYSKGENVTLEFPHGSEVSLATMSLGGNTFVQWGDIEQCIEDNTFGHVQAWVDGYERHLLYPNPKGRGYIHITFAPNPKYTTNVENVGGVFLLPMGQAQYIKHEEVLPYTDALVLNGIIVGISDKGGKEGAIHWKGHRIELRPHENVFTESIQASATHVAFVTQLGYSHCTYWHDGKTQRVEDNDTNTPGAIVTRWNSGFIFRLCRHTGSSRRLKIWQDGHFVESGFTPIDPKNSQKLMRFGTSTIIFNDANRGKGGYKIEASDPLTSNGVSRVSPKRLSELSHGFVISHRDNTFEWLTPNPEKDEPFMCHHFPLHDANPKDFSCVENASGAHLLNWVFTGGTLHILRYKRSK